MAAVEGNRRYWTGILWVCMAASVGGGGARVDAVEALLCFAGLSCFKVQTASMVTALQR